MILRELFVKLGLDIDLQSFTSASSTVEKLGEAVVNLAAKFVENVQRIADSTEEIDGLAQSVGVSTDALQRMGKAAALEGMGLDALAHNLVILDRNIGKVGHGAKTTEEAFTALVEEFSAMPDGVKKTQRAIDLFGRGGAEMIQVLNNGQEAIEAMRSASIMSPAQIAAGKELIKIQRQLAAQTRGLWRDAVAPLLPAITDLLARWRDWKKANAEVIKQQIKRFLDVALRGISVVGRALDVTIGALAELREHLGAVSVVLGAVGARMIWLARSTVWAGITAAAPWVALAGVIGGILLVLNSFHRYKQGRDSVVGDWLKSIEEWTSPNHADPWWLAALKQLVGYMQQALGLATDLGLAADKVAPKDATEQSARRTRAITGPAPDLRRIPTLRDVGNVSNPEALPMGQRGETTLSPQARISKWFGWGPFAAPSVPTVAPPTATPRPPQYLTRGPSTTSLTFQINGGDPAAVRHAIGQELDARGVIGRADLEAAHAATGGD